MGQHRADGPMGEPPQAADYREDDLFLHAIADGVDPSYGADPLASMLLDLRDEVYAPAVTPDFGRLLDELDGVSVSGRHAATSENEMLQTTIFPAVASQQEISIPRQQAPVTEPAVEIDEPVDELAARRRRRQATPKSTGGWFGHGLIGAAAATVIIAGGGMVVHSAEPGDPLWGLNQAIFGSHAAVVELSATLEEAENRNANGDVKGALELLEQARQIADQFNTSHTQVKETTTSVTTEQVTTTVTTTQVEPAPPAEQVTTTVTVTPSRPAQPTNIPQAPGLQPGVPPTTTAVEVPAFPTEDQKPTSAVPVPPVNQGQTGSQVSQPSSGATTAPRPTEAVTVPGSQQ